MARATTGKVSRVLKDALDAEVKEVCRKYKADDEIPEGRKVGDFIHSSMERMRVYNSALKLAALELKIDDPEYGKNFGE